MSNQMQLQLAKPNKLHCDEQFAMITVPGSAGEVGVMFGHAPMALTINAGSLSAFSNENTIGKSWFVVGGYCEVTAERCTIMADEVFDIADLNKEEIEAEISSFKKEKHLDEDASKLLQIAELKLSAINTEL